MKSVSFNQDQATSSGGAATSSNLKGLYSQTNGIAIQGKRNSNLRQNFDGISNTTNCINKDGGFHRTNFEKFSSDLTPKVATGGAYSGILEA